MATSVLPVYTVYACEGKWGKGGVVAGGRGQGKVVVVVK